MDAAALRANNDVIDGNVDEFDEESNKAHDGKSNCGSNSDLLELCKQRKW